LANKIYLIDVDPPRDSIDSPLPNAKILENPPISAQEDLLRDKSYCIDMSWKPRAFKGTPSEAIYVTKILRGGTFKEVRGDKIYLFCFKAK